MNGCWHNAQIGRGQHHHHVRFDPDAPKTLCVRVFEICPFLQNRFGDGRGTEACPNRWTSSTTFQNLHHIMCVRQTGVSQFHSVAERVGQDRQRSCTWSFASAGSSITTKAGQWQKTRITDHAHGDGVPQVIPCLLHHLWSDARRIATGNYDWPINHL